MRSEISADLVVRERCSVPGLELSHLSQAPVRLRVGLFLVGRYRVRGAEPSILEILSRKQD